MADVFSRTFHAGWGDMDFNSHMRNTAYLDISADVRMMYFEQHGFTMRNFERLRVGPVIVRDELDYFREVRLLERYEVRLFLAGLSADGSRFRLRNEFATLNGERIARVTSSGGWLDLEARRLITPPAELIELLRSITPSSDYSEINTNR
jgi:acyl-CoA thioester hydrolase